MPILSALHASDFFFSKNEVIPKLSAIRNAISAGVGLTQADRDYIDKLLKISPEFAWSHKCCNMLKDNIEFLYLDFLWSSMYHSSLFQIGLAPTFNLNSFIIIYIFFIFFIFLH